MFNKTYGWCGAACLIALLATCRGVGAEPAAPAGPATQPATQPSERFFNVESVGDEVLNERAMTAVGDEMADKVFRKEAYGRLAADWAQQLPRAAMRPVRPDAVDRELDFKVPGMQRPTDVRPAAEVARFSDKHLVVRICRPAGNYLWHHYRDNLATLVVERGKAIDEIFDLPSLERDFAGSYKGISQGNAKERVIETLGQPDGVRGTQAMEFEFVYYEHGGVEIALWQGRVLWVRRLSAERIRGLDAGDVKVRWR